MNWLLGFIYKFGDRILIRAQYARVYLFKRRLGQVDEVWSRPLHILHGCLQFLDM